MFCLEKSSQHSNGCNNAVSRQGLLSANLLRLLGYATLWPIRSSACTAPPLLAPSRACTATPLALCDHVPHATRTVPRHSCRCPHTRGTALHAASDTRHARLARLDQLARPQRTHAQHTLPQDSRNRRAPASLPQPHARTRVLLSQDTARAHATRDSQSRTRAGPQCAGARILTVAHTRARARARQVRDVLGCGLPASRRLG